MIVLSVMRQAPRVLGAAALILLVALAAGCKKKDVAQQVAEQAAIEAAEAGNVTREASIDEIGIPVVPGARATERAVRVSIEDGAGASSQATYRTGGSFDDVLGFYRTELAGAAVTEATSGDGRRSAAVTREERSDTEVASLTALLTETEAGVDITLCSVRRAARFSVYLNHVPDMAQDAVVQAICGWKGIPPTPKEAEVQRQEAKKLMTVLPRPVDTGLPRDKAQELVDSLVAAGGEAEIR